MTPDIGIRPDRPVHDVDDIEVTPEMIEAGQDAYWEANDLLPSEELVIRVYSAMKRVSDLLA